jgi:ABC-type transporter Mla subunit MlaD
MSAKANYFKIGVFILSAVALAVVGVIVLGAGALFEKKIIMETYFDESVQGLGIGAPVKYRGVTVGSVEHIGFVRNEYIAELPEDALHHYGHYIVVRLSIKDVFPGMSEEESKAMIARRIEEGLRVRLTAQGITGVVFLEADFLDPNENPALQIAWKPKYLRIPSARSTVSVLSTALTKIAKDLEQAGVHKITADLDALLVAATKLVKDTDVERLTERAGEILGQLQGTIQEAHRLLQGPEMKTILSDASATTAGARRIATDLLQASKQIKVFSDELPGTIGRLEKSLRRIDTLLSNKNQDVDEILDNLRVVSENLREVTTNAKRYPSQVLLGEPPPRTGSGKR